MNLKASKAVCIGELGGKGRRKFCNCVITLVKKNVEYSYYMSTQLAHFFHKKEKWVLGNDNEFL